MKKQICSSFSCLLVFLLAVHNMMIEAQECQPSGQMSGTDPPQGKCNPDDGTPCCKEGESYTTYECSPPVSQSKPTQAIMTKNSFQKGGEGGAASACDGNYHNDNTLVVALSTGWFNNKERCNKDIIITINSPNGRSVKATVVDECASNAGCDEVHAYQQPCRNNIVDASEAVWQALGVEPGEMDIDWSDA